MIISFDYDDTLKYCGGGPCHKIINVLRNFIKVPGTEFIIVTARNNSFINHQEISMFIAEHKLPIKSIHYVNHELKGPTLKKLGAIIHYDDCIDHCVSAAEHGVRAYLVENEVLVQIFPEKTIDKTL